MFTRTSSESDVFTYRTIVPRNLVKRRSATDIFHSKCHRRCMKWDTVDGRLDFGRDTNNGLKFEADVKFIRQCIFLFWQCHYAWVKKVAEPRPNCRDRRNAPTEQTSACRGEGHVSASVCGGYSGTKHSIIT